LICLNADGVRMAHPVGHAGRPFDPRRPAVDRELSLAIQDDEHFFRLIVEMLADPAVRGDHATMDEDQVGAERAHAQQLAEVHRAGTRMDLGEMLELGWVAMADPLGQRGCRQRAPGQKHGERRQPRATSSHHHPLLCR
jgi:hypothetical protein